MDEAIRGEEIPMPPGREPDDDFTCSTVDVSEAFTLPPHCYTDPAFYEFEKRQVFLREWLCVGRVEQVPNPGDYFTVTVAGETLIVVRDRLSRLRVMSAVCRHRGTLVTAVTESRDEEWRRSPPETHGSAVKSFRCPYHQWTYDLDGSLVACPEMARSTDFDKSAVQLPQLAVELWNGFVFANFDTSASPLAPRLARLGGLLANWRLGDMVGDKPVHITDLPWNWKVMQENSIETYHADRLHGALHRAVPSRGLRATPFDESDGAIISNVRAKHPDYSLNPTEKAWFPPIATLTDDERQTSLFALVPPTLLLGVNSDSAFYRLVLPKAADRVDIVFSYLVPAEYRSLPLFDELVALASDVHLRINRQDFMINASVQHGLSSAMAPRGRYSWQEEPLVHFNRWLVKRYREAV